MSLGGEAESAVACSLRVGRPLRPSSAAIEEGLVWASTATAETITAVEMLAQVGYDRWPHLGLSLRIVGNLTCCYFKTAAM